MKRVLLGIVLLVGSMSARAQELGANYNQNFRDVYNPLIVSSGARWVRAFVNIPRNYLEIDKSGAVTGVLASNITEPADAVSNDSEVLAAAAVSKLIETTSVRVSGQPVKIILSLKVDFKFLKGGVPDANSQEMVYLFSAIEQFLTAHNHGAYIDILVVGNEPMFEVPVSDADKYGTYLNLLIDKVAALRAANAGWKYEIFTGALNRAHELGSAPTPNPILQQIVNITKANSKVSGIDLHLHVDDPSVAEADVNFIRNSQGISKKIISTEFSLVGLWDAHKNDPLGAWGKQNGYPEDMRMFEWLNSLIQRAAAGNPINKDQFMSFFNAQPWYPKNWFATLFNMFRKYGLYAATYGLEASPKIPYTLDLLNENSTIWVLNFVYNGTLLGTGPDGYYNANPLVYPEFRGSMGGQEPRS